MFVNKTSAVFTTLNKSDSPNRKKAIDYVNQQLERDLKSIISESNVLLEACMKSADSKKLEEIKTMIKKKI